MLILRRIAALAVALAPSALVSAQTPPPIVFDDFDYESVDWSGDRGLDDQHEEGSIFGWNFWYDGIGEKADSTRDRLWYLGDNWAENSRPMNPAVDSNWFYRLVDEEYGMLNGGIVLRVPDGYCGPRDGNPTCSMGTNGQIQIGTGFAARRGVWAARINFSDLNDVIPFTQSFWTHSPYKAVNETNGYTGWSEMDHEFNNFFRDDYGHHDQTGFFDGEAIELRSMYAHPWPTGTPNTNPLTCKIVRWGSSNALEDSTRTLQPWACSALFEGNPDGTRSALLATFPALAAGVDFPLDVVIVNKPTTSYFFVQGSWTVPSADGLSTETYYMHMGSDPFELGASTQPMAALLSQYVGGPKIGCEPLDPFDGCVRYGNRPLERDHPMAIDWFFYTPDYEIDLADINTYVNEIRNQGFSRVNSLGRSVHRPYTNPPPTGIDNFWEWTADNDTAAYMEAPAMVAPGALATFIGSYAHRMGDLGIRWQVRLRKSDSAWLSWTTFSDEAWLVEDYTFPTRTASCSGIGYISSRATSDGRSENLDEPYYCALEIRMLAGEQPWPWVDISSLEFTRVTASYVFNGTNFVCTNCAALTDPLDYTPGGLGQGFTDTAEEERSLAVPLVFGFRRAFPNPTSDRLTLDLALPHDGRVNVAVFDMLGRQVITANFNLPAGYHAPVVNLTGLATGTYAIRVRAGADEETRQITVLP